MGELCVWGIFIMTYSEKLKDPRWRQRRLEILERDEYACQDCGHESKSNHVHHIVYRFDCEVWEYPDNELKTFCASCHEQTTRYKKELKYLIDTKFAKIDRLYELKNLIQILSEFSEDEIMIFTKMMRYKTYTTSRYRFLFKGEPHSEDFVY